MKHHKCVSCRNRQAKLKLEAVRLIREVLLLIIAIWQFMNQTLG